MYDAFFDNLIVRSWSVFVLGFLNMLNTFLKIKKNSCIHFKHSILKKPSLNLEKINF